MIVVDIPVFVDLFFEYDRNRTRLSEQFFENVNSVSPFEPELFNMKSTFKVLNFIEIRELFERVFLIALETGCKVASPGR